MKGRSPIVIIGAGLGGCLMVLACVVMVLVSALVLSRGNPLEALAPTLSNRIAYVGNDMNIYVADPSGKHKTQLTTEGDGGDAHRYDFPSWAPDARHLAFVGINYSGMTPTDATLYSVEPTGNARRSLYRSDQSFPFYLYWSPDSRSVTFLTSKDGSELALEVANPEQENSVRELDSGNPLYWAWSPDARNLFVHIGGARSDSDSAHMSVLPWGQSARAVPSSPGSFQAPSWSPDGKHLLFSQQAADGKQAVMIANAQGQDAQRLFDYDGRVSFGWSPRGDHIAYIVTPSGIQLPTFGAVRIVNSSGQNDQQIADHVLAFMWSPSGERLAYLTIQMGGGSTGSRFPGLAQAGGEAIKLQWQVKDLVTGIARPIASFSPTDSFVNTLPFFDQYARSATFWSPDSLHFVYSNAEASNVGSIYVADVVGGAAPRKIADGLIAFWSWK